MTGKPPLNESFHIDRQGTGLSALPPPPPLTHSLPFCMHLNTQSVPPLELKRIGAINLTQPRKGRLGRVTAEASI